MNKRSKKIKTFALGAFWCLMVLIYIFRLFSLQVINGDEYLENATKRSYKTQTSVSVRGEIFDADGEPIVTNRMGLSVTIDMAYIAKGEENTTCSKLISILKDEGVEIKDGLPISTEEPYIWTLGREKEISKLLKTLNLKSTVSAVETLEALKERYSIDSNDLTEIRELAGFRYEMELRNFAVGTPFVAATDISAETASRIKEQRYLMNGVDISVEPIRVIVDGTFAPHVIGRTGLISAEEADKYSELGYPLNATVGKEGIEKAFESTLRGTEGTSLVEVDSTGKVVAVHEGTASKAGNTVWLTLRKRLQQVAQDALEKTINNIRRNSGGGAGHDANAGSVVAMNPNTGEIYAMATYPSYDSTQYSSIFSELISDPDNPLLNRAISGTYPPGSTFKIATALAGLENGVISTTEKILDKGRYTYYEDYQPKCWVYDSYGSTHGLINVSEAIKTSCNYYFFETGRRLGIDKLEEVCTRLGLGQKTGIEISGEADGVLASRSYKEKVIGEQWYGGDDLQAAIGQSYHLFTPLQIASYISTVVNGGTRYQAHLLSKITDYNDGTVISQFEPTAVSTVNITEEEHKAIMSGMRSVTEEGGTAAHVFSGYPINVGGKTGTSSVSKGTANGVFVGFAPYENPEIVICVLIEHAGSGNGVAPVAKAIMDAYFKFGEYADNYVPPISSSEKPVESQISQNRPQPPSSSETPALPPESESSSESSSESAVSESSSGSGPTPPESNLGSETSPEESTG